MTTKTTDIQCHLERLTRREQQRDELVFDPSTGELVVRRPQELVVTSPDAVVIDQIAEDGFFVDFDMKQRLSADHMALSRYFPNFQWFREDDEIYLEGEVLTSSGTSYVVRLVMPWDYPSSYPQAYVWAPRPLKDKRGRKLSTYKVDGEMHLLDPDGDRIQICHYSSAYWTPLVTLYKVIIKCRLWLEAYECHLRTGEKLDRYLPHQ